MVITLGMSTKSQRMFGNTRFVNQMSSDGRHHTFHQAAVNQLTVSHVAIVFTDTFDLKCWKSEMISEKYEVPKHTKNFVRIL